MKLIKKKSTTEIPKINGAVVDTSNVDDKTTNAPSLRLVKEMTETVEDFTNEISITQTNFIASACKLQKYGKLVKLFIEISRDGNWNSNDVIATLPKHLRPSGNERAFGEGTYSKMLFFRLDPEGNITIRQDTTSSNWLAFSMVYILD